MVIANCELSMTTPQDLFNEHLEWSKTVAGRLMRAKRGEREVSDQAAMIGLWLASREFDPERGQAFKRFAFFKIHNLIIDEYRVERKKGFRISKDEKMPSTMSIIDPAFTTAQVHDDGPDCVDSEDTFHWMLSLCNSPRHIEVLIMRFQKNMTLEQIGAAFGFSQTWADTEVKDALERLRWKMEGRQ